MAAQFRIHVGDQGTVLRVGPELGGVAAPLFRRALRQAMRVAAGQAPYVVLVDMADVHRLDSAALGVLLGVRHRLPKWPQIGLCHVRPRPLLDLAGADVLRIVPVMPCGADACLAG